MANLNTMYPGVANSPDTYLREPLASGGSILYVIDGLVFGNLPTLATIGEDQNAETVLVLSKRSDNGYDITRAIEGTARDWIKGSTVARNFTNKDFETFVNNINLLNSNKVEKVENKDLSTYDYDLEAKTKVDAIPNSPEYTDTKYTAGANVSIDANGEISATDTTYTAGTNVTINESNVISTTDTTYDLATISADGLMSSTDKTKINNIEVSGIKVYASTDTIPTLPNGVVALIYGV